VWTNTCCGHPLPDEPVADGARRRLGQELGIGEAELALVLPRFRYQARMANGVLENELCPVYAAYPDARPEPDPAEVAEIRWAEAADPADLPPAAARPRLSTGPLALITQ
jgi:isopentenyl-diphosphate delta-isomerase